MRRISRRELLGLGAAAGVVAVSGAPADALPARGGSLRLGLAGRGFGPFDGRRPFDPIMRIAGHGAVFDCLTEIGADGAIRGELATGWKASPDARVWTFRLREDAVFHDGRAFGADDVVATLRLHMHMAASAKGGAPLSGGIAQVRRTGSHEVQITLRSGSPGLPFLLSDPQFIILPAGNPEAAMRDAIGTGLYRVVPGATTARAVLRRVDRHYKDGQAGWFDRVEILAVPDPRARLEALKTGRVDAVNLPDPAWQDEIRRHGRIALAEVRGPAYLEIAVEGGTEDDAQAVLGTLDGALDRGAMLSGVLQGRGRVAEPVAARAAHVRGGLPVAVRIAEDRVPGRRALVREVLAAARRAGLSVVEDAPLVVVARLRPGRPTADWPALPGARLVPVHAHGLIAHSIRLQHGTRIGGFWDMDSGRIAERWWYS